jgi:hypothetical protein
VTVTTDGLDEGSVAGEIKAVASWELWSVISQPILMYESPGCGKHCRAL